MSIKGKWQRCEFGHLKFIGMKKNLRFFWWKEGIIKQSFDISKLMVLMKATL